MKRTKIILNIDKDACFNLITGGLNTTGLVISDKDSESSTVIFVNDVQALERLENIVYKVRQELHARNDLEGE